jgi:diguanylate cyclase (GGDEF)-like protein
VSTRRSVSLIAVFVTAWAVASGFDLGTIGMLGIDALSLIAVGIGWWATTRRPHGRAAWVLVSAGLSCWLVGDVIWDVYTLRDGSAPAASLADVFYLAGYPLLIGALVVMVRGRVPDRWKDGLLDGLGLAVVASLAAWQYLIGAGTGSTIERGIAAAYPLADMVLLAMFAWLALSPGRNGPATRFMWAGVGGVLAVDLALAVMTRTDVSSGREWLDNSYPVLYLLIALALGHVTSNALAAPRAHAEEELHPGRVIFLGIALFGAPALTTLADGRSDRVPHWAYLAVTLAVGSIVLTRFVHAVREVEKARQALGHQARHDPLTGLYNRASLMGHLTTALADAERRRVALAVLYIDLDRFKPINDTFGHGVGDELLRQVGDRLRAVVDDDAVVARLGGDEFVILAGELCTSEAQTLAKHIVTTLVAPFALSHGTVGISASVGVALSDPHDTAERVLKRADAALYDVKQDGRNGWRLAALELVAS